MTETTMSFRMEKLRSNNFIKNYQHSNRNEENSNHSQLAKNIDKSKIKDNVFLVNNTVIDNCKNISEVWQLLEEDYKNYGVEYQEKKINKKVKFTKEDLENEEILLKYNINIQSASKHIDKINKDNLEYIFVKQDKKFITEVQISKCKVPFIRKTQNSQKNVNDKKVNEEIETSLISEFVFQLGGVENDIRDNFSKEDYIKAYNFATKEIHKETKGTILKSVIHFDEAYPHLHLFFTPYNLDTHKVENDFTKTSNNLQKLQDKLFVKVNEYLQNNHTIKLKPLQKKSIENDKHHLTIKEFKKVQDTKKLYDKDFIDTQRKEDLKVIAKGKVEIPLLAKPFIDTNKYILLDKSKFTNDFKSIQNKYIFTDTKTIKETELLKENYILKSQNKELNTIKKEFLTLSTDNIPKKDFNTLQSKYDTLLDKAIKIEDKEIITSSKNKKLQKQNIELSSKIKNIDNKYYETVSQLKQKNQDFSQKVAKQDIKIKKLKSDIKEKNFIIKSLTQKIKSVIKDFDYDSFINRCKLKMTSLFSPTL